MTGRKVNKPGCATVRNQATALFSLPMRLGQHVRAPLCPSPGCSLRRFFTQRYFITRGGGYSNDYAMIMGGGTRKK